MDEKKFLENIAKFLQVENVLEDMEHKKTKEQHMLSEFNDILNGLSGETPQIEKQETIEEEYIEETAGKQPQPELPTKI